MNRVITILLTVLVLCVISFAQAKLGNFSDLPEPKYNPSIYLPVYNYANYSGSFSSNTVTFSIQEVHLSARTFYDLQSNGIAKEIWQDENFPNKIHALFMVDTTTAPGNQQRWTRYFLSNDTGNTWVFKADVPPSIRSGFPCITTLSDGRAAVINHTTDGGAILRTQLYIETAFASNIFERKDPGSNLTTDGPIWPVGISTSNISNAIKIVFLAAYQSYDTLLRNSILNLGGTGNFSGYSVLPVQSTSACYSVSRSGSRVGIVYIKDPRLSPNNTNGSVYFTESTDNGTSWNSPVTVWNANLAADSLGCLRSADICYSGISPKVFFSLCKRTPDAIMQNRYSKMMLWSPQINGSVPITVDSAGGMAGSNPFNTTFTSVCRGVIGVSTDANVLFASWCRARNDVDPMGNCYFDVWFSYSVNGGLTWLEKTRLTNLSGPLRDCKYPSISPFNKVGSEYVSHIIFQLDSVAGSYPYGAPLSLARMIYTKVTVPGFLSINNISNSIPEKFSLSQNYPNPFNPTTNIEFSIPKSGHINLIIYDAAGREVATLVNGELKPGTYKADWDASKYASGLYFYKLEAESFTDVKKMVYIK